MRRARRAHPRSRGENDKLHGVLHICVGSSPLTRGKRASDRRKCRSLRLIPAHAGKTARKLPRGRSRAAHPRSRGENSEVGGGALGHPGLIPAHAGKTSSTRSVSWPIWAHPRSRGENTFESMGGGQGIGSSPLTRGKREPKFVAQDASGLIPAHAGKT